MSAQTEPKSVDDTEENATIGALKSLRLATRNKFDVFVLSESGKPVYCYSNRSDSVTLMGVCVALISYVDKTQSDSLRSISTCSGLTITFSRKSPLIIVVVNSINDGIDPLIVVNQVNSQIVSTLTNKTLKSVFEQRPTFDLKRLLTGSEKLIDTLIEIIISPINGYKLDKKMSDDSGCGAESVKFDCVNAYLTSSISTSRTIGSQSIVNCRPNHTLNRIYIPIVLLSKEVRESFWRTMTSAITASSDVVFSLLFSVNNGSVKLIIACNHNPKAKLTPLDMQLIYSLVLCSENQLSSVESFWLPICLPRFDSNHFLHAHISYLNSEYCLALLTTDRENFHRCQQIKESLIERLSKVHIQSANSILADLCQPQLQYLWYQSQRQSVIWQQCPLDWFASINYYIADRMLKSNLKTFWLRSETNGVLLGWHSPTFQLYAQFDVTITQLQALQAIQAIVKWIKKEESKFIISNEYN